MILDVLFLKKNSQSMSYAKILNGSVPVYSQFGRNIYVSDVVNTCVDCIANEISKLKPRHIKKDSTGQFQNIEGDNINRLLRVRPNPWMTTRDLLEKMVWSLYLNYNAWAYPAYELVEDAKGNISRRYTAIWPLQPVQVEWLEDARGELFVRMRFRNGKESIIPYSDLVHLRKKYSVNDLMGGNESGNADNAALLKTLEVSDKVLAGTADSIKLSQGIRGILKINTTLDDKLKKGEREKFVKDIEDGGGVIVQDFKGDFTPVSLNTKTIDNETLKFLEDKVLRWFGVSLPILNGDFTDVQYNAFFNKTLEPLINALNQSFTSVMLTQRQQDLGDEINFYHALLEMLSVQSRVEITTILGDRGALTNNYLLSLFGLPPYEGGDVRNMSLNYIDTSLANEYQLARAKAPQARKEE